MLCEYLGVNLSIIKGMCMGIFPQPREYWGIMARRAVKNGFQKDTCHNEIRPCAQNIDTRIGSIIDTFERPGVIV